MPLPSTAEVDVGSSFVRDRRSLQLGDLLVMDALTEDEFEHRANSDLQGARVDLAFKRLRSSLSLDGGAFCCWPRSAQGLPAQGLFGARAALVRKATGSVLRLCLVACRVAHHQVRDCSIKCTAPVQLSEGHAPAPQQMVTRGCITKHDSPCFFQCVAHL